MRRDLSPADAQAIEAWASARRAEGASAASVRRAAYRVKALARHARGGVLQATRGDVFSFAASRARARGLPLREFTRSAGWQESVRAWRAFFAWTTRSGYLDVKDPVHRLRLPPSRSMTAPVGRAAAKYYDALLRNERLDRRTRCMLHLLALGMLPRELVTLRLEDLDLDAGALTLRRGRAVWSVPLTDETRWLLRDYLLERGGPRVGWLFPTNNRQARPCIVRDALRRAARATFPRHAARRAVRPSGFRDVYLQRLLRQRLTAESFIELARFGRVRELRRYVAAGAPDRVRAEWLRIARRCWPVRGTRADTETRKPSEDFVQAQPAPS